MKIGIYARHMWETDYIDLPFRYTRAYGFMGGMTECFGHSDIYSNYFQSVGL